MNFIKKKLKEKEESDIRKTYNKKERVPYKDMEKTKKETTKLV